MAFNNDLLIDQDTGTIDVAAVRERATLMACRDYGGHNPPPAYIRSCQRAVMDLAIGIRATWLFDRGLPADGELELVDVSGWTDTFRRVS